MLQKSDLQEMDKTNLIAEKKLISIKNSVADRPEEVWK